MSRDLYPVKTPPVTAFFDHLRALENDADYPFSSIISSSSSSSSSPLSETFLSKSSQPFVRPKQRLILFNWMAIVCQDNLLKRQTYHSAVSMVDRYTRKRHNLRLTEFQCLGAACVSLSSKLEEIHPPSLEDLSEATGGYVAKQDISNMEFDVCSILGWRLLSPTVVSWIGALCYCVGSAADAATDLLAMRSSQKTLVNALDASSLSSSSIFSSSRANTSQQGSSKGKVPPSSTSSTTAKASKTANNLHAETETRSNQKKRKREGSIGNPRQSLSKSKSAAASLSYTHSSDKKIQSLLPFKKVTKDAQVVSQMPIDTLKDSSSPLTLPPLALIEHSLPISKALFAALLGCSGKLTENGDPHVIRDIPQIVSLYSDEESCATNGLSSRKMSLSLRLPLVSSKRVFPEYLYPVAPSSIHLANTERALEYDTNHAEFVFVSSSLDNNSSTSSRVLDDPAHDTILSSLSESSTLASSQGQGSSQIHSQGSSQSTESAKAKPSRRGRSLRKNGGEKSGRIDCGVIESSQDSSSSLPSISSLGEPSSSRLLSTLTSLQNKLPSKLLLDCFTVADACVFHVNVSSFPPSILSAAILMVVLRRYKEEAEVALADERTRGEGEVHGNISSSPSSFLGSRDSDVLMRLHNLMPLVVEVVRHVIFDTVRCSTTNRSQGDCSIEKSSANAAEAPATAHPKGGSPTNSNRVSKCYDEDGKLVETLPSSSMPSSSFSSAFSKTAPVSIVASEEARVSSVYIPTTLLSVPILSSRPEKEEGGRESREKHLRKDVLSCVSTLEIRWNILIRAIAWVYSMTEALPTYTPHVDIVSCPNELAQFIEKSEWQLLQTTSASLSSHVAQKLANFDDGSLISTALASDADLHTATIVFPEIVSSWHGSKQRDNVEQLVDVVLDTLNELKKGMTNFN